MPNIYDNALCTVNGKILVQNTTINVDYQDADKPIPLLHRKFAIQPSGRVMKIGINEAISTKGFEFDWIRLYLDVEFVTFGVVLLGRGLRLISHGVLTAPGFQFAVGAHSSIKLGFIGEPAAFE